MKSIQLKNYKCFEDTGELELRPLNFLVGSNSSGKSSFLEFFPLLQQSMKINRDGAFLWVGSNVDTNNFETVVRHGKKKIEIVFNLGRVPVALVNGKPLKYMEDVRVKIVISTSVFYSDSIEYVEIYFNEQLVKLKLNEVGTDRIDINGEAMINEKEDDVFHLSNNSLIPSIAFNAPFMEQHSEKYSKELLSWFKSNLKENERLMPGSLIYRPRYVFDRQTFEDMVKRQLKADVAPEELNHIYNLSLLFNINDLIDIINYYMIELSDKIEFIQPLRANAERYYRKRNISVSKISPSGDNIAMFFLRLKKENKLVDFNSWLNENNFEFWVDLNEEGGFVEMKIVEKDKEGLNMVDVGFGYSQILPILATIWKELYYVDEISRPRSSYCNTNLILIEQPELHLHPRFQIKFSDMLAKCIEQAVNVGVDIKFIIETHSQDIINNIGRNIAYKKFDPSWVNIYIFNAENENMGNYIENAGYTNEGFLNNWPVGFFS